MSEDKYLRVKQVCERTGLSRPTIYNMMKTGTFPINTALGVRAVAWLESEIVTWMEKRKTFEKTGMEAKPGRPPTSSKKKNLTPAPSSGLSDVVESQSQPNLTVTASEHDGWGPDEPPPTKAEMEETQNRLSLLSRKIRSVR